MTITMMKMIKFWDIGFDSSIALESALSGCNRTPVPKENEKQLSVPKRHWLCALGAAVSRLFFTSRSNFDFFFAAFDVSSMSESFVQNENCYAKSVM